MPLCHILHWKKLISNIPIKFWSESANYISLDPIIHMRSKRKSGLEGEKCSKKSKLQENSSSLSKSVDELLSDDITVGLKRRLRLDETSPAKKIKQVEYSPGEWQLTKLSKSTNEFIFINKLQHILKPERFLTCSCIGCSVNAAETQQPVRFSCSFVNGHAKRPRDEEMVTSISCKRVRWWQAIYLADWDCIVTSHGKQNSRSVYLK